jgi:hypothetical protein
MRERRWERDLLFEDCFPSIVFLGIEHGPPSLCQGGVSGKSERNGTSCDEQGGSSDPVIERISLRQRKIEMRRER